jgi:transposase InsO family protein
VLSRIRLNTDRGCQYTSAAFADLAGDCQVALSVGCKGQCWDNAVAESFFSTLELELIDGARWQTRDHARRAIFEFIETWHNRERRHSTLGYRSPATYAKEVLLAVA